MSSSEQLLQAGVSHLQRGELPQAEKQLRKLLKKNPKHADATHLMGLVEVHHGHFVQAEKWIRKAVALGPDSADYYANLGDVLRRQGRLEEAVDLLTQASKKFPQAFHVWHTLGLTLILSEQPEDAQRALKSALLLQTAFPSLVLMGQALAAQKKCKEALSYLEQARQLRPSDAELHHVFGNLWRRMYHPGKALESYAQAIRLDPKLAAAYNSMALTLVRVGRWEEAVAACRQALACEPENPLFLSNLALVSHYGNQMTPQEIFALHQGIAKGYMRGVSPKHYANFRVGHRRLRVGYVSADFKEHPVAFFMEPILRHHNREAVEVFCYSHVPCPDAYTAQLQEHAEHWRPINHLSNERVSDLVAQDGIDVLVDLGAHTGPRLGVFARKAAPIQVTYLGYPDTTGLETMDYRLTDGVADPVGMTEAFHTEQLVRLPGGFLCYAPHGASPEIGPLPADQAGFVTFVNFNNPAKITTEWMRLLGRILAEVPRSKCVFKSLVWGQEDDLGRQHMAAMLAECGVSLDRVELLPHTNTIPEHLAHYGRADIALDTFPYAGTTTTCDALWMGVPVVSLAGKTHVSRVGASLLSAAGLSEWVASTPDEYVQLAVQLAKNTECLRELRASMRTRMGPLLDAQAFASKLEDAYRAMAREKGILI